MLQSIKKDSVLTRTSFQGTKLIFVVGLSGSGKTTLLEEITNQDLGVGHSAKSGMRVYIKVLPAVVHGEKYLFVDTPGFGVQDLNDRDVYEDITSCVCTLGQWVTIAGVMFVHDMRLQRLAVSEVKTIRWLQCFCGPRFFEDIAVVLTQWDRIIDDDMYQARYIAEELETSAFREILSPTHVKGGRICCQWVDMGEGSKWDAMSKRKCPGRRSSMAADFVRDCYERSDGVARLRVLEELARGWGIYETEAAASLFNNFSSATVCVLRHKALIMDVDEELKPKVRVVKAPDAPTPPQENRRPDVSRTKWWEIAIEVAHAFWGFRKTGHTKFTGYERSTAAAEAWERLKTWWSGKAPPQ
ncbi:hypothetical protein BDV10DRAFT_196910 [Aspergillus recurvatus]